MDRSRVRQGQPRVRREVVARFWEQVPVTCSVREAATRAGIGFATARWVVAEAGGVRPRLSQPSGRYLSFAERELVAVWRAQGAGVREIARRLGRAPSTVSRELAGNGRTHVRGPLATIQRSSAAGRPSSADPRTVR